MLRRIRHKLRMIRYYSAPRRETVWTRAWDTALWVTLVLALPAAWVTEIVCSQSNTAIVVRGYLTGDVDDSPIAWMITQADKSIDASAPAGNLEADAPSTGQWKLTITDVQHGWPLITSVRRLPAQLDLDIRDEPRPRTAVQLDADSPLRAAIASALTQDSQIEALDAWNLSAPCVTYHWTGWLAAGAGWWILMMILATSLIQTARLVTMRVQAGMRARRYRLHAAGKCAACGYDLTGLEFNERCPECGTLVW